MLKSLLEDQRKHLNQFFNSIDLKTAEELVKTFIQCKGIIIFSGVGKSGHIAEKIAATFLSTGTRSFYLNPANALHGDIGFVSKEDIVVLLSKSGESQELIELLSHVQKRGVKTVALVSTFQSKLAKMCDQSIVLPVKKEICPFDLAPTTSSAIQLIFADCLAIALMRSKKFSIGEFAANHPAGLLGRKVTFKVADLMLQKGQLPLCRPTDLLLNCLYELSIKRCGCLMVINEKETLMGIFTDGDLRRAIQSKGPLALKMSLVELMTSNPKSIHPDSMAVDAARVMEEDPSRLITVLPVVKCAKVVGLIRMHDILQKEFS